MEETHPDFIVAAIRAKGITLSTLAAKYGLPKGAISTAIQRPYEPAEQAVIDFLGVAGRELWPDRYNSDGSRKRPQPQANYRPRRRFAKAAAQ